MGPQRVADQVCMCVSVGVAGVCLSGVYVCVSVYVCVLISYCSAQWVFIIESYHVASHDLFSQCNTSAAATVPHCHHHITAPHFFCPTLPL
jgi:hypothetical protein